MEKIIAACGNNCAACPRYTAHPYEKTSKSLRCTAELWMKIGYRDHVVSSEEIACTGCKPENWCRYHVVKCCEDRGIPTCAECAEYPCGNLRECFAVTKSFEPACREVCTDEEYEQLRKAFFEKEKNLESRRRHCDQEHPVAKKYACITLRERPELLQPASAWFHKKWGVPQEAYQECMTAYLNRETEYGWYLCLDGGNIIGGLGIIQNDFHDRKDLAPNVCAVYTEEAYRGQGIAERLLNLAVEDMRAKGISPLYLVTDHIGFYERYGWEFLCMAHEDDSGNETRVYIHR